MDTNDYIASIDKAERRYVTTAIKFHEVEENGSKAQDKNILEGYAAVFNSDSENFGGWVEQIARGAFSDVLKDNAFALFNHDMNQVLGRNGVNLSLSEDDIGLRFSLKLPDTTLAADIRTLVSDGILNKCSFAFTVAEERFIKADEKTKKPAMRIIEKMSGLYDVSVVTVPAYADTSVGARGFKKLNAAEEIKNGLKAARGYMKLKTHINKSKFLTI